MNDNLNNATPDNDGNYPDTAFQDNSTQVPDGSIRVYFREIESRLVEHINEADAIFGCIAWLTNPRILAALATKETAIVVQKEDFLRPDLNQPTNWKTKLRKDYNSLKCSLTRYEFANIISTLSVCGDPTIYPIRCVGNHNRDKTPAFPRMHNKFLVFARITHEQDRDTITPYAVWTGSFNFTVNAVASLENALYLTSPEIVGAFFEEFGQIMALSEPLDWESDWMTPEWRIGT